ncbi:glycosyltransferase family 32 protein [Neurospora crassa]|uniref:Alpha-1,6-mannosyltransferase Och1 n=1 Tax=Neurospora crassa (strain ATCC 24698 / 74-OR23-1A / CBS 708.71 / DSM 1257 / FGSC 987) TaxID=367110 RepID=Q7S3L1_NEUCR|nr:alpha-1,6-mannosyltransferase Och1 [Neurospora crassa OR74A]EAA30086.1 alpha-1,6-mannosyltransferase Och1 [Neurospora crassa OR74A]KHE86485.1 glycosyltransferase family 32 protein [Neurospora crassa]|eukprot:XP_959322.1 alpha-1,6-mannosyltransferase Och1 [Neurospora crassa OR74A]
MSSPPLSPLSPLSPTLGNIPIKWRRVSETGTGAFRNRIPTQLRRALPLYAVVAVLLFLMFNAHVVTLPPSASSILNGHHQQQPADHGFPKKIWQSWKVDPYNMATRDLNTAKTWTSKNPGYRYELLTDNNDMVYVEEQYGPHGINRPDIIDFYRAVNISIIKADLLRYLIMYAEGGVYADIDVEALRPIKRFVPERYWDSLSEIDMVVGIEIDQPEFRDHPILGSKCMSFCQWTFMCKPRLPVMLNLVENIMTWLNSLAAQQQVHLSELHLDFDEVISGTGPSAFTIALLKEMNRISHSPKEITWDNFHAMDESKVVSRVLVLDVEAFAAGQGHSDSGNHNARGALVKHHYHASNWPSKHPRYAHPVYGEVERCNWDLACVQKWDRDVEAYKSLSIEEQNKLKEERRMELEKLREQQLKEQEQAIRLEQFGEAVRKAEEEQRRREELEREMKERMRVEDQALKPLHPEQAGAEEKKEGEELIMFGGRPVPGQGQDMGAIGEGEQKKVVEQQQPVFGQPMPQNDKPFGGL